MPTFDYFDLPTEEIERVNDAFNVVEFYGFDLQEKAGVFGFVPGTVKNLPELRNLVLDYALGGNIDMWDRIEALITIRQKLDKRFGANVSEHLRWLATNEAAAPHYTCLDLMGTGHLMDLRIAAGHVAAYMG